MNIQQLAGRLHGRLIAPGDSGYDEARQVFVGGVDRKPACIARVADADDVAYVIEFARESGLELSVRSGGHSWSGASVSDGGIVVDLRALRALTIDEAGRTAWAETRHASTRSRRTSAVWPPGLATPAQSA